MKTRLKSIVAIIVSAVAMAMLAMSTSAALPTLSDQLTTSLFNGILTEIIAIVVIMIPVIAGFWAFRKGWRFYGLPERFTLASHPVERPPEDTSKAASRSA